MNEKFDLRTPSKIIRDPNLSPAPGLAVVVLTDGKQVLTSGLDFYLRLWDIETGLSLKSWDARGPIYSIQVIPDGNIALLGAVQGVVLWDIKKWELCPDNTLWAHSLIYKTAYSERTGEVLACGEDTTIHRWNLQNREKKESLPGHSITITAMDIDHGGQFAITGDLTGEVRLWDLNNDTCIKKWQGHEQKISAIKLSSNGNLALSGSADGNIALWDLQHKQAICRLQSQWVTDAYLSKDAFWAVSCGDDELSLWDLTDVKRVANYEGERIIAMSISPDESVLAALVKTNHVLVWDNILLRD